ncbi:MAG: XRE family transcriptional regulator [Bdellovibrionota bacterium]
MDVAFWVCMYVPGIRWPTKLAVTAIRKIGDATQAALPKVMNELDLQKKILMKEINKRAAYERAKREGLKPIDQYSGVKTMINEQVIRTVKESGLRHIDVADFSMLHRPRVTKIMNRHLNRVSIDCMFKVLSALGVKIEIKFK